MSAPQSLRQTMRAAVISAPGHVEIEQVAVPEPGPAEVRIKLEGCGVCASNIPPWEGREWFKYPMPPGNLGHEGWGAIDALGEGVTEFVIGDRVAFLSNSSYAEYDVAPVDSVVKLPEALRARPFPGEPLGCAMNIFARSGIRAGDTVAVVGVGFLGALLTKLATDAGAKVMALARKPYALQVARRMGAQELIAPDDAAIAKVSALTGGRFCDVVIECTGKQEPLDMSAELTRERGRLLIAGFHQDGPRHINMFLWNWRGLDVINAHERETEIYLDGIRSAVDAVADGRLNPDPLYTHSFPLSDLDQALDMTRERPEGFMKALIRMEA